MEIDKVAVNQFFTDIYSVTGSAAQVFPVDLSASVHKGVCLKAPATNTLPVYIGRANVTASQTAGTGGFPLDPGESLVLPITLVRTIYAIAGDTNQKLNWILV